MELVRKVSTATLAKGVDFSKLKEKEEMYLGRIVGFAKTYETVPTQFGEASKFIGEFMAERVDGTKFMSGACYLPTLVSELISKALDSDDANGVRFGFDVSASYNEKSKTNYEWKVMPLMEVTPSQGMLEFSKGLKPMGESEDKPQVENVQELHDKNKKRK